MTRSRAEWFTVGFALIGLAISSYLTWVHFEEDALVCGVGDCATVQASRYSELLGIPIAILGIVMFVAILALVGLRRIRPEIEDLASTGVLFLVGTGVLYYVYLTYIELSVLEAICQWCVLSSLMTVGILVVEGWRFLQEPDPGS